MDRQIDLGILLADYLAEAYPHRRINVNNGQHIRNADRGSYRQGQGYRDYDAAAVDHDQRKDGASRFLRDEIMCGLYTDDRFYSSQGCFPPAHAADPEFFPKIKTAIDASLQHALPAAGIQIKEVMDSLGLSSGRITSGAIGLARSVLNSVTFNQVNNPTSSAGISGCVVNSRV